jgi:hypothetical protein
VMEVVDTFIELTRNSGLTDSEIDSMAERAIPGLDIKYERSQHHFLQAELSFAKLVQANLQYADLRYANLYKADLNYADLTGANLQGATARVRAVVPNDLAEEPVDDEERAIRRDLRLW